MNTARTLGWIVGAALVGWLFFGDDIMAEINDDPLPPAPTSTGLTESEQGYVDFMRDWSADYDRVTVVDGMSDREILEIAYLTCEIFESGATSSDVVDGLVDEFGSEPETLEDALAIAGAANGWFCPEYE